MGDSLSKLNDYAEEMELSGYVEKVTHYAEKMYDSMAVRVTVACSALLVTRYCYYKIKHKVTKFPPGHIGLPFLGSMIPLGSDEKGFFDYLRTFGAVSSYSFFNIPVVVLHDPEVAARVLKDERALSRPQFHDSFWKIHEGRSHNLLAWPYGNLWNKHRKIVQTKFMLLLNSKTVEETINTVSKDIIFKELDECAKENRAWFPLEYLKFTTFNSIYKVLFGHTLGMKSKNYLKWTENTERRIIDTDLLILFGFLGMKSRMVGKYLASFGKECYTKIFDVINEAALDSTGYDIHQMLSRYEYKGEKYIKYPSPCAAKSFAEEFNLGKNPSFNNAMMFSSTLDEILFAGYDTTYKSGEFTVSLLAKHTDIQEQLYQELSKVYKENNIKTFFSFDIIRKVHLFRAFIWETLRVSSLAKVGLPREATADIKVGQYVIPKGTVIMLDMKGCNIHNKVWLGKGELNLKNWLDEDDKFVYNKNFLGLSTGRRDCPGKGVVHRSFYCLFANLIINYKLEFYNKNDKIEEKWALTNELKNKIGLRITKRQPLF